jgi:cardiolipin synthase
MLTIPNALTFLRFLGIPLFLYLTLDQQADGWAILVLAIGGATDYFDGKLARAWGQTSRFGEIADPTIDRLYILAVLIALFLRDAIPLWLIATLLGRDLILGLLSIWLSATNRPLIEVTYLGKAATFNLLYAFPFLLLALSNSWLGTIAFVLGWAFAIWGTALYLFTGISYFRNAISSTKVRP